MARKSYGNTIKYEKRTGYVQGNTVRKLQEQNLIPMIRQVLNSLRKNEKENGNSKERYDVPIR